MDARSPILREFLGMRRRCWVSLQVPGAAAGQIRTNKVDHGFRPVTSRRRHYVTRQTNSFKKGSEGLRENVETNNMRDASLPKAAALPIAHESENN